MKKVILAFAFIGLNLIFASAQDGFSSFSASGSGGGGGPVINGNIYDSYRGDGTFGHTFPRGTITTSDPFVWSQTWNAGAVTFQGFNLAYTRTALAADSQLFSVTDTPTGNVLFGVLHDASALGDRARLTFNTGGALTANSYDFSLNSTPAYVNFGTGNGGAGTRNLYAGRITLGQNWSSGTIETELGSNHLLLNSDSVVRWGPNSGNAAFSDTGISRLGAGILAVGNKTNGDFTGSLVSTLVQTKTIFTVATLPTCDAAAEGTRASINDALGPVALSTVVGGGAVHLGVYCNGTNWIVQ